MKIGFDVSYIQKGRAGIGRHALQLVKALLANDAVNEYVLHGWSLGIDLAALNGLRSERVHVRSARIPGDLKRLYWNRVRKPPIEMLVGDVSVFHSTDPLSPLARSAKRIVTVHDLAYKKFPHLFEPYVVSWDKYVRRSVESADGILVPSKHTQCDLLDLFRIEEDRVRVLHLPVAEVFFRNHEVGATQTPGEKPEAAPYILFVGTLEPRKNIPRLITAFDEVHRSFHPDVDLVIAGKKGWMYEESFRAMKHSEFSHRIRYLDYVTDTELSALYKNALFFVYPSLYEGYGFPILEAMASGIPIITSRNSSMEELSDGVALLVDPEDLADLVEAMRLLIQDEVMRLEMGQRGEQACRLFTAGKAAKEVLTLYRDLA